MQTNLEPLLQEEIAEMGAEEPGTARDELEAMMEPEF